MTAPVPPIIHDRGRPYNERIGGFPPTTTPPTPPVSTLLPWENKTLLGTVGDGEHEFYQLAAGDTDLGIAWSQDVVPYTIVRLQSYTTVAGPAGSLLVMQGWDAIAGTWTDIVSLSLASVVAGGIPITGTFAFYPSSLYGDIAHRLIARGGDGATSPRTRHVGYQLAAAGAQSGPASPCDATGLTLAASDDFDSYVSGVTVAAAGSPWTAVSTGGSGDFSFDAPPGGYGPAPSVPNAVGRSGGGASGGVDNYVWRDFTGLTPLATYLVRAKMNGSGSATATIGNAGLRAIGATTGESFATKLFSTTYVMRCTRVVADATGKIRVELGRWGQIAPGGVVNWWDDVEIYGPINVGGGGPGGGGTVPPQRLYLSSTADASGMPSVYDLPNQFPAVPDIEFGDVPPPSTRALVAGYGAAEAFVDTYSYPNVPSLSLVRGYLGQFVSPPLMDNYAGSAGNGLLYVNIRVRMGAAPAGADADIGDPVVVWYLYRPGVGVIASTRGYATRTSKLNAWVPNGEIALGYSAPLAIDTQAGDRFVVEIFFERTTLDDTMDGVSVSLVGPSYVDLPLAHS